MAVQGGSRSSPRYPGLSRCGPHAGRGELEAIPALTGSCLTQQGHSGSPQEGGEEAAGPVAWRCWWMCMVVVGAAYLSLSYVVGAGKRGSQRVAYEGGWAKPGLGK